MDTAQIKCDFLWLGHSLLTVKGDDNQEVAEKIKARIIHEIQSLDKCFESMAFISSGGCMVFLLKVNYAFGLSANVGIPKPRQP